MGSFEKPLKFKMRHGYCKNCGWYNKIDDNTGYCELSLLYNDERLIMNSNNYCFEYIRRKNGKLLTLKSK